MISQGVNALSISLLRSRQFYCYRRRATCAGSDYKYPDDPQAVAAYTEVETMSESLTPQTPEVKARRRRSASKEAKIKMREKTAKKNAWLYLPPSQRNPHNELWRV